ncbi:MAG: hypothetical protein KIS92_13850 [Planctomycetota bacterium]|nr:hypothetical protein [Planctomycetota bacterium]
MPSFVRRTLLAALAVAALLPAACRAEEPAVAEPPKLPEGVEPLDAEMQAHIEKLKAAAQQYRGLELKNKNLAVGQKTREALKKKVVEMFKEEMPKEVLSPLERTLKNFDLIPQEMDLGTYYPELLTSQIGGYYDPQAKYLVLVKDANGILGQEMTKKLGKGVADKMEETVLVHEIDHAIQDQHFDLSNYGHDKTMSDAAAAKLALIEGDATLVMYGYMLGVPMERFPGVDASLDMFVSDPVQMANMMPEMPGSKEIAQAPAYIRDNLIFSYIQGLNFCLQVRKAGGQKLLDHAFVKDPPKSTEQILHPEKWIAKRDDPVEIELPDLAELLPGFKKTSEGNWGEFNTRLLLAEKLGQAQRKKAAAAAQGWGGDKFALYTNGDGKEVLVWYTAWDTPEDAGEFYDTGDLAFKQGWQKALQAVHEDKGVSTVVLVRGELAKEGFDAVKEKLFALKLARPANANLDLAKLGITDEDKPKMLGAGEMMKVASDPTIKKLMAAGMGGGEGGEADVGKLLDDPRMQDAMKQMGDQMLGEGGGDKMKELMKNPAVQKMMQDMLKQDAAPKGQAEDGAYVNKDLGIAIKSPKSEGWKIDGDPPANMGVKPLVQITGPDEASIVLMLQAMPMQVALEQVAPLMEMGPQMQFQNYKRVNAGFIKSGETKGYELEYTGSTMGQEVHVVQRVFLRGPKMLLVVGTGTTEGWEKHGKDVKAALETLTLSEPAAKKDAPKPEPKKEEDNVLKE